MKVDRVSHVAILVKDLEKTSKFFGELFNTKFTGPTELKEADVKTMASPIGIEIVSPLTPDGPTSKTLERRGEGLAMLAIRVANLDQAMADMQKHGVRLLGKATPKAAQYHPRDLHGVMIELIED